MSKDRLILDLVSDLDPCDGDSATAGPVPGDVKQAELSALLAAARVAPSADNAQTWRFVAVRAPGAREALADAVSGPVAAALRQAQLVLVACGIRWLVTRVRREQPFVLVDVPIAVTHILLQAQEMGLACAWTLDCDEASVRELLGIPDEVRIIALLALGRVAPAG